MRNNAQSSPIPLLSAFPYLDTRDPGFFEHAVNSTFHGARIEVKKEKAFHAVYNYVNLGRVSLHGSSIFPGLCIHAEPTTSNFVLNLMHQGDMSITSQGGRFLCSPGKQAGMIDFFEKVRFTEFAGYQNLVLRFTRQGLEDTLERIVGVPLRAPLLFDNPIDLNAVVPKRATALALRLAEDLERDPVLAEAPLIMAQYEELLIAGALTYLPHNHSRLMEGQPPCPPPKVVHLVEEYVQANLEKPLRMRDLAVLTGMSVRSIQAAFQKHRSYTPSHFLRRCRLSRARELLRAPTPNTTILAVSLASGFSSPGRFSSSYREQFGEYPLVTLRKARD